MTPMDKLREAMATLDIGVWPAKSKIRDLYNAAKAVLASAPVVLTEAERATVEEWRHGLPHGCLGERVLAIIDRIAPKPEPKGLEKLISDMVKDPTLGTVEIPSVVTVEPGSREWALVMAMRGRKVLVGDPSRPDWNVYNIPNGPTTGWRLQPKPGIAKGDRVKWWRGEDSGTGTYIGPVRTHARDNQPPWFYPHDVEIHGDVTLGVDRVEPLSEVKP